MGCSSLVRGKRLGQFIPYTTSAKFFIRVAAVGPLGVENGEGFGELVSGAVVIANDDVDALLFGILHLFQGFDPAIQGNDQGKTIVLCKVNSPHRQAIPFFVTVRDVGGDLPSATEQKGIHQGYSGGSINVIVPID